MYTIMGVDYLNAGTFDPVHATSDAHRDMLLDRIDDICTAGGFDRVDDGHNDTFERYYVSGAGGLEIRIFCFDNYSSGCFKVNQTPRQFLEEFAGAFGLDLDTLTPV